MLFALSAAPAPDRQPAQQHPVEDQQHSPQQLLKLLVFILAYGGIIFVSFKMILKEIKNMEKRLSENPEALNIQSMMITFASLLSTFCLLSHAKTFVVFEEHRVSFTWITFFTLFFHSGSLGLSILEPGNAVLHRVYCFITMLSGTSGLLVASYVFLFEFLRLRDQEMRSLSPSPA